MSTNVHGNASAAGATPLERSFFGRDPQPVARELLNKVLVVTDADGPMVQGRIVETEAYGGSDDPGSHGYRGITPRTEIMFGPPGYLYVYFTYGMHWCANVVTGSDGDCSAVLLRAVDPLAGIEVMRSRRMAKPRKSPLRDRDLCNGPAKLCQAFAIDGADDGRDLMDGRVTIVDDGVAPPPEPGNSTRIGLSPTAGADIAWRWFVAPAR